MEKKQKEIYESLKEIVLSLKKTKTPFEFYDRLQDIKELCEEQNSEYQQFLEKARGEKADEKSASPYDEIDKFLKNCI